MKDPNGDPNVYSNIFVTPDMSKAEREENAALRRELDKRRRDESNNDLVIYKRKIIDRKEIPRNEKSKDGTGKGGNPRGGVRPPSGD